MTFHDTLRHVPGRRPGRPQADPGRCAGDNIPFWFILHPILHRGGVRNGARGRRRPGRKSAQNRGFRQESGRLPLAGRRAGGPVRRDFFQKIDRSVQLRWDGGAVVPKKNMPPRPTDRESRGPEPQAQFGPGDSGPRLSAPLRPGRQRRGWRRESCAPPDRRRRCANRGAPLPAGAYRARVSSIWRRMALHSGLRRSM